MVSHHMHNAPADTDCITYLSIAFCKQGSGPGLPIARALVELHGGRLWVESTPGAGATCLIAIPAGQLAGGPQGRRLPHPG